MEKMCPLNPNGNAYPRGRTRSALCVCMQGGPSVGPRGTVGCPPPPSEAAVRVTPTAARAQVHTQRVEQDGPDLEKPGSPTRLSGCALHTPTSGLLPTLKGLPVHTQGAEPALRVSPFARPEESRGRSPVTAKTTSSGLEAAARSSISIG